MIDTQEKLDAFVEAHHMAILAHAITEFADRQFKYEDDVWQTYRITHEEQVDINTYIPEDGHINITAYALREFDDGTFEVNTQIGCLVADIKWEA